MDNDVNDQNYHPTRVKAKSRFGQGDGGICRCGRLLDRPHCPQCGSRTVNAVKKYGRKEYTTNGIETVMGYACRTCGHIFQDDSTCGAGLPGKGGRPTTKKESVEAQALNKAGAQLLNFVQSKDKSRLLDEKMSERHRLRREGVDDDTISQMLDEMFPSLAISKPPTTAKVKEEVETSLTDTTGDDIFGHKE